MSVAEPKSERLNCRVSEHDHAVIREAAALERESMTEFVIESALERAERLLADRTRFSLASPDWEAFVASLDEPAQANPAVVEAFRRAKP